jgi:hypothetical protein
MTFTSKSKLGSKCTPLGTSGTPLPASPEIGIGDIEVKGIGEGRGKGQKRTGKGIGEKGKKRDRMKDGNKGSLGNLL